MAPSSILVTGATGFVGRHALKALRQRFPTTKLIGTTQSAEGTCPGTDSLVSLNLLDPASVERAIAKTLPSAVLHLAAQAAVGASFADPLTTWQINLLGTVALAEAVLRHIPGATFVFASSAEVYGLSFRAGLPLTEKAAFAPANPYAAAKAAADLALGEMALRGLRVLRMRPFNHIGPGQSDSFVVASFARQIARIKAGLQPPVIHTGALDRWRDMIDVRDVCAGYAMAIERAASLEPGTVFNLASGKARCVGDILQDLIARAGLSARIETDPGKLRPTDIERTLGDASLAAHHLGWSASIPWDTTLQAILDDWHKRVAAN